METTSLGTGFQYPALNSLDSIRLLTLQPGLPGSKIHCDVEERTLLECNDIYENYTALSYVWGAATETKPIVVNGHSFEATINLVAALDDHRDERRPLRLWVDAICIDQSNTQERNL